MSFMAFLRRLFAKPHPCAGRERMTVLLGGGKARIQSFSDASTWYELDLKEVRCTCPDWQKRRAHLHPDSPGRLCKHLVRVFAANPRALPPGLRDFARMVAWSAKRPIPRGFPCGEACRHGMVGKVAYVLGVERAKSPWVNVHAGTSRYGFNLVEQRWAYGDKPPHAAELEKMAHEAAGTLSDVRERRPSTGC